MGAAKAVYAVHALLLLLFNKLIIVTLSSKTARTLKKRKKVKRVLQQYTAEFGPIRSVCVRKKTAGHSSE